MQKSLRIVVALLAAGLALACSGNEPKTVESAPTSQEKVNEPIAEPAQPSPAEHQEPAGQPEAEKAAGKKVLMVIAPDKFRDEELFEPRKALEEAGHQVVLASTRTEEATGMLGGKATPTTTIAESRAEDYDAVVFIGGSGTKVLLDDKDAHALAKSATQAGKLVAAICMAPEILANAGLLEGKKATSWGGGHDNLKAKGAEVVAEPVVEAGQIITGSGPQAATAFGQALVRRLAEN